MPNDARAQMDRAREYHGRGEIERAIDALREAAALDPTLAAAHKNLSALLWRAGRIAEARDALVHAVAILPAEGALWARLARMQADLGDAHSALASLARAEAAPPADASTWAMIGAQLAEYGRWADAERNLERAASLDPGAPEVELRLAHARQENGDDARALQGLARGVAREPTHLNVAVDERLYLPQLYEDAGDAGRWRARYAAGLGTLAAQRDRWLPHAEQVLELNHHNFLLAYQGEDDLELQRAYSRFLAGLARHARPQWFATRAPRFDGGRRLRVGFASGIFRDCTAGRYFERWITGLDAARFERFVYHTAPLSDEFTRRIAAGCEHFATLRNANADTVGRILADDLDVLIQPEVGMTPLSYLMAALRLAPVQLAGWGHPVTTGSDNMDAFITCEAMEPQDAARHYAERLVALPGLGVDYPMPPPPAPVARAALGLPEGRRLYVCPQSLFKVHPDMDALLARLLAADEEGLLLFFQAPSRAVSEHLGRRVQRALEDHGIPPRGQVKFLPRLSAENFRRVLACADVVVDTLRWSGGNTSLDALAAGTPIVTLPGRFMRGRQTAAMLAMAGVPELVAASVDDYVRIAVEVARDRDRNAGLRERIRAGREALFERREPIAALSAALLELGAGARP
jgi:predicted O-linked N-acetylglucosamine transferase (SPINDLY family)